MSFPTKLRAYFWQWLTKTSPSVFYHPLAYPEWERMQQDRQRRQEQAALASGAEFTQHEASSTSMPELA